MNDKLVSVFCLTYNHVDYIRDALEGFVKQKTNFKYDVFVYDDASTDGTSEIIMEYKKKYPDIFNVYISERNTWKDDNRHRFLLDLELQNLHGKYIALCEGDDYWTDENKLQVQVDYFEEHPECSMYIHNCEWVDCTTNISRPGDVIDIAGEGNVSAEELIMQKKGNPPTASFMFRRKLFKQDFFFFDAVVGDYPLLLCAANIGDVHYNSKEMSVYRYKANGSWTSKLTSETDENKIFKLEHYIGIIDFLLKYDKYTELRFHNVIQKKYMANIGTVALMIKTGDLDENYIIEKCMSENYKWQFTFKIIVDVIKNVIKSIDEHYIDNQSRILADKCDYIYIMGTGRYSEILTEQFRNNNIDFSGYVVTDLQDNKKKFNGKTVFQLDKLPYDRTKIGVVVGIFVSDKDDIINSLNRAGILNYTMPYNYE